MIQENFNKKINKILRIDENVDVVPTLNTLPILPILQKEQVNIVELMEKQTSMILSLIKELSDNQNILMKQILDSKSIHPTKEEFREKVINLTFDEKGNPIGAEIKLKPYDEVI